MNQMNQAAQHDLTHTASEKLSATMEEEAQLIPTDSDVEALFPSSCDEEGENDNENQPDFVIPADTDIEFSSPEILPVVPESCGSPVLKENRQLSQSTAPLENSGDVLPAAPVKGVSFAIVFDQEGKHGHKEKEGSGAAFSTRRPQISAQDLEQRQMEAERRRKEIRERKVNRAKMSIQKNMQINAIRQERGVLAPKISSSSVNSELYQRVGSSAMAKLNDILNLGGPSANSASSSIAHSSAGHAPSWTIVQERKARQKRHSPKTSPMTPAVAASRIQIWYRKRRNDRESWRSFFGAGLTTCNMKTLRFEEAEALIQSKRIQAIASELFSKLQSALQLLQKTGRFPRNYKFLTFNARAILSAYIIISHPSTFSCGGTMQQESALLGSSIVLLGVLEKLGEHCVGPSNVADPCSPYAEYLLRFEWCWKSYIQSFKVWRRCDLLHMENQLKADYLDLVRTRKFILGPESAPRPDRPDQIIWNGPLEQQIATLRMRIGKVGGAAALERLRVDEEKMITELTSIHKKRLQYAYEPRQHMPATESSQEASPLSPPSSLQAE